MIRESTGQPRISDASKAPACRLSYVISIIRIGLNTHGTSEHDFPGDARTYCSVCQGECGPATVCSGTGNGRRHVTDVLEPAWQVINAFNTIGPFDQLSKRDD